MGLAETKLHHCRRLRLSEWKAPREIENAPDRFMKCKLIKLRISKVTMFFSDTKKDTPPMLFVYLRINILEHQKLHLSRCDFRVPWVFPTKHRPSYAGAHVPLRHPGNPPGTAFLGPSVLRLDLPFKCRKAGAKRNTSNIDIYIYMWGM